MPHMIFCGRYFRFATDEFSIPGICAVFIRLFWCALLAAISALIMEPLRECDNGEVLIAYLSFSIFLNIASIVCEAVIVHISLKGTMVNESAREGLTPYLALHLLLGLCQLACSIFGCCVFAQNSLIPCYTDFIDENVISVLLLVTVVTQLFDITLLSCCFGLIYQWKRVEYKPEAKSRLSLRNSLVRAPSKKDLLITFEDEATFKNNIATTAKSVCKCLQISSCNIFGGGNISDDITTVAGVLTPLFHHEGFLDVVPSDVVAGIILVRLQQRNFTPISGFPSLNSLSSDPSGKDAAILRSSISSGSDTEASAALRPLTPDRPRLPNSKIMLEYHRLSAHKRRVANHIELTPLRASDFELMREIAHYSRYSLAVYTHLLYLYMKPLTGACKLCYHSATRCSCCDRTDPDSSVLGDNLCSMNRVALMRFTKKLNSKLIYANFKNDYEAKPFAVFADVPRRTVIISIRGTLSLEDCITDLNAELGTFEFEGKQRFAHKGMLLVANYVYNELKKLHLIETAAAYLDQGYQPPTIGTLRSNDFGLVTTGHSMGAAGSVILALLLKKEFPQVRCFSYGTPGSTIDKETSILCQSYVLSVCLGSDIICRMSVSSLALLRTQILDAISRAKVNKMQILQSLFKEYRVDELLFSSHQVPDSDFRRDLDVFNEKMKEQVKRYHGDLQIPGRVIHLAKIRSEGNCCSKTRLYVPVETFAEEFGEIQVSPTMLWDHFPNRYVEEVDKVLEEWTTLYNAAALQMQAIHV